MEQIKNWISDHDVMCVSAFIFISCIIGGWLYYTANRTANDYHHVTDTVQSVESDNQQARQQIGNATAEINSAQKQLRVSIKRTGEITESVKRTKERTDSNSKIIGECEDIISAGRRDAEEARGIFDSVDKANKVIGAQADSNP